MTGKRYGSFRTGCAVLVGVLALAAPAGALASQGRSSSHGGGTKNGPVSTNTNQAAGASMSAQGVVQSVGFTSVVVKQLDGSTVTVPVDRKTTQIFVNSKHVQLADVKPGYVLSASWKAGKPAPTLKFVKSS